MENQFTSPVIDLGGRTVTLNRFTQDFGSQDIEISNGVIDGGAAAPVLLNTTLPDNNPDGIYVVYQHPAYSYGGGFAHIELEYNTGGKKVLYTQGTVLEKKQGVWSRYFEGYGFKTSGSIVCKNVTFQNCLFYLFSPFGLKESKEISFIQCNFNNVSRVLSSCMYGSAAVDATWCNALSVYSVYGDFRVNNLNFTGCRFSNIHTSIVWGCPPARHVSFTHNEIKDCPTTIAFMDTYMKRYLPTGSDESWWVDKVTEVFYGNRFINILQANSWTTALIRTCGLANINDNDFLNVSPQIILFYGGNSIFENNRVYKFNTAKERISTVIMTKNVGSPVHIIRGNYINADFNVFVAVEGTASFFIEKNIGKVMFLFNKQSDINGDTQFLRVIDNEMNVPNLLKIASRLDAVKFGKVEMLYNNFSGVITERVGNTQISIFKKV